VDVDRVYKLYQASITFALVDKIYSFLLFCTLYKVFKKPISKVMAVIYRQTANNHSDVI